MSDKNTRTVGLIKDWNGDHYRRQTPQGSYRWNNTRFVESTGCDVDYYLVLNRFSGPDPLYVSTDTPVLKLLQEPYIGSNRSWISFEDERYDLVLTHAPMATARHHRSFPALPWLIDKSFDELSHAFVPKKTADVSFITSRKYRFNGHRLRHRLIAEIERNGSTWIDVFGRDIRPIATKSEALSRYRYSIAIENTSIPDYWTEKIADCFLEYTVPLYWGCPNIEEYFPPEAMIRIDPSNPKQCLRHIEQIIYDDDWTQRIDALLEARRRVLWEHTFGNHIDRLLDNVRFTPRSTPTVLNPWKPSIRYKISSRAELTLSTLKLCFDRNL